MAATTTITPTSAPATAPTGDPLTGDVSELGVGSVITGGRVSGLGSMVGARSPVVLPLGIVVPEIEVSRNEVEQ